jgi:hypothetical protein
MEKFNRIHAHVRNIIESSFGVWKMKSQILYKMLVYPLWKQNMIAMGTMVVHNFICEHKSGDLDFDCVKRDEDNEPTISKRYNEYVVPSNRSTTLPIAPTMDVFHDELARLLRAPRGGVNR